MIVRPLRGDHSITIDAVLFDRHSNFVGPISELVGGSNVPRYVVRSDEICRRFPLRQGDTLYYYNCDRVDMNQDNEFDDLKLVNLRSDQQTQSSLNLKNVINNLKNLRIDDDFDFQNASMIVDEREEAISREAKASPSTASLIYQLGQKKRLHIHSHRKFREEQHGCMDEESGALGKRCQPSSKSGKRKHKKRSGLNRSSGSSRLSYISEPSQMYSVPRDLTYGVDFRNLPQSNQTSGQMMEEQLPGCWPFQDANRGRK